MKNTLFPTKITTAEVPDVKPGDIVVASPGLTDVTEGTSVETGDENLPAIEFAEPIKSQPFVIFAEVMPSYKGGNIEMIKFIQRNLHFPMYATRVGISGTAYVSFVVSTSGTVTHVEIVKGIDKSCDEEAMLVISRMNKWTPGMQNKMPVAVRMVLPIKFVAGE